MWPQLSLASRGASRPRRRAQSTKGATALAAIVCRISEVPTCTVWGEGSEHAVRPSGAVGWKCSQPGSYPWSNEAR
eukprot:scaffold1614_cov101-Isochrysis_galbana.AAC.4